MPARSSRQMEVILERVPEPMAERVERLAGSAREAGERVGEASALAWAGIRSAFEAASVAARRAYADARAQLPRRAKVPIQHVLPREEGWAVQREGSTKATAVLETKQEAIEKAREIAEHQAGILVVHRADGSEQYRRDLGPE